MKAPARSLFVAEPSAQYLVWPPLVVDCSTLAGLLFHESWRQQAFDCIHDKMLHAPYLLQIELASVAAKKHKLGRPEVAIDGLLQFSTMNVELHEVDPVAVLGLALRYKLSAYDAAYLWLAAELKTPLATFDEKLATAAQAHLPSLS